MMRSSNRFAWMLYTLWASSAVCDVRRLDSSDTFRLTARQSSGMSAVTVLRSSAQASRVLNGLEGGHGNEHNDRAEHNEHNEHNEHDNHEDRGHENDEHDNHENRNREDNEHWDRDNHEDNEHWDRDNHEDNDHWDRDNHEDNEHWDRDDHEENEHWDRDNHEDIEHENHKESHSPTPGPTLQPTEWTLDLDLHVTLDGEEVQHAKMALYLLALGALVFLLTRKPEDSISMHWSKVKRGCARFLWDDPDDVRGYSHEPGLGLDAVDPSRVYRYVEMDSSSRHGSQHSQHSQHGDNKQGGAGDRPVEERGRQVWTRAADPFP